MSSAAATAETCSYCLAYISSTACRLFYPEVDSTDLWDSIKESFEVNHGIPGIVGAINSTRISLLMPVSNRWKGMETSWMWVTFFIPIWFSYLRWGPWFNEKQLCVQEIRNWDQFDTILTKSSNGLLLDWAFGCLKNRLWILLTAQRANVIHARNNTFAAILLHNFNPRGGCAVVGVLGGGASQCLNVRKITSINWVVRRTAGEAKRDSGDFEARRVPGEVGDVHWSCLTGC
ncbi:hypothetical protein VP01_564g4 [Puccinia sorghi]|uniref:Uncharacterized protein n=1 Tax=Puccinia sorghi TaxID=27349 RepID=A0A0L6UKY7_9BASI|nr:hypothetical protein VP01_564g4 [Puccinia sorghi]